MSSIIASKFYKEMYEILKNPNLPKYKVVMELNDVFDLVLIKKIKDNMENYNIYDGLNDEYKDIGMDINIFNTTTNNLWHNMTAIKSYSDLVNFKKIKNVISRERTNFPISNLFDNNFESFWEKNKDSSKFLISFEKSIILNNINLFTENRENKSKDTFHNQSLERVPTNINIKGSNNLEKWRNVIENAEINFNKNKSNYNFINQNKYKYYLIELKIMKILLDFTKSDLIIV